MISTDTRNLLLALLGKVIVDDSVLLSHDEILAFLLVTSHGLLPSLNSREPVQRGSNLRIARR